MQSGRLLEHPSLDLVPVGSAGLRGAELLYHPQLFSVVVIYLPVETILDALRPSNASMKEAAEQAVEDVVTEYALEGNAYLEAPKVHPFGRVFRVLNLALREGFQHRVVTLLPGNDRRAADTWTNLGNTFAKDGEGHFVFHDSIYTKRGCYVKALEIAPSLRRPWYNLGCILEGTSVDVGDRKGVTARNCFIESVLCDQSYSLGWNNLACNLSDTETVAVDGKDYSKSDLFLRALQCDPSDRLLWMNTGLCRYWGQNGDITVNGSRYSRMQCVAKAVELGEEDGWYHLGVFLQHGWVSENAVTWDSDVTVSVNRTRYTAVQCFGEAFTVAQRGGVGSMRQSSSVSRLRTILLGLLPHVGDQVNLPSKHTITRMDGDVLQVNCSF